MDPVLREYLLDRRRAILLENAKIEQICGIEIKTADLRKMVEEFLHKERKLPPLNSTLVK